MRSSDAMTEVARLKARIAALEQLLEVHEQAVIGQAGRIEAAIRQVHDQAEALRAIASGTAAAMGDEFFRSLVASLASALKVRYIYIGTLREPGRDRIATLAVWADGALRENIEYDLAGTPCEQVVAHGLRCYYQGVQQSFPQDRFLAEKGAESYCGTPLLDRAGRVIGLLGILHDQPMDPMDEIGHVISIFADRAAAELERKRVEEALRESEDRFRSAFEKTAVGMVLLDNNGRFLRANRAFCTLVGYSEDELLPKTFLDITHPEDLEKNLPVVKRLMAGEIESFFVEKRYLHKQGRPVWVHASVASVRDASGKPLNFIAQSQDITERKRVEEELRESQSRFMSFMEYLPGVSFIKDQEGHHLYANKAFETLLRLESGVWQGKTNDQLFPPDIAAQFSANDRTVLTSGRALEATEVTRTGQGTHYWLSVKFPMPTKDGAPAMLGGIAINVTEQKRLEEQLRQSQKMEAVWRLAGGVAHDFNNLLTVINGYSELLLRDLETGRMKREHVEEIKKAGDRAKTLTGQLLAFSRRQVVQPRVLDLNGVVTNLVKMLHRVIGEHIRLVTALEPAACPVKVDPGQLDQLLMNLALNARDAMPDGGTLTVETMIVQGAVPAGLGQAESPPGPHVRLAVRDTGCGMSEETKSHIFEPFFTTKEQGKGTGLGLAMVYGIVAQSGGAVTVESAPGQGTTFAIYWPQSRDAIEAVGGAGSLAGAAARSETILLVEDESIVRTFVRTLLVAQGYHVLEAASGEEALPQAERHQGPIHLLLTDVVMPGMNGRCLAEQIAAARPETKVLFMSGYTDDVMIRQGVQDIGAAFLQKPFEPAALYQKVRELLDGTRNR